MTNVDLTQDRLFSLGWGLVFKAVCAPAAWDAERVSAEATREDPPGTSVNRWVVSDPDNEREDAFKGVHQRSLSYRKGDFVTHNGNLWCALKAVPPGMLPGPEPAYWQLAAKGPR